MFHSADIALSNAGPSHGARVCVDRVSWRPRQGPCILHPASFEVEPGQILGIVGANGAGKSTLLRLLYRYLKPTGGKISLDNRDIWSMSARDAAQSVAAVLQEQPTDFALTVHEIVLMGRLPHRSGFARTGAKDEAIITQTLGRVDMAGFARRLFGTLSGGERQRVMIARALAQEPRLLIMDEPTNHLDIRHQLEVMALMQNLGPTIITSLHDVNLAARHCDKVLMLAKGKAIACGKPAVVLTEALISRGFAVRARRQRLHPSGDTHLTFQL